MIKKLKIDEVSIGIEATKSKGTRNKIWNESTFWYEIILKF